MPTRQKRRSRVLDANALVALMAQWPTSWAGVEEDEATGTTLVEVFRPFLAHLLEQGLSPRTVRRHLDNLWFIGGETIRSLNYDPTPCRKDPRQLLLDTIFDGEAPFAHDATENEQRSLDATARKLLKFLTGNKDHPAS